MASQKLVILDIGLLMGSRSPQVLDEHIAIYPGAQKMMDQIVAIECRCENPMCKYDAFQYLIESVSGGNPLIAAEFLEAVEAQGDKINSPQSLRDFFFDYRHETHKDSWLESPSQVRH